MASKDRIPSKFDVMKAHSHNFLDSERIHWGIIDGQHIQEDQTGERDAPTYNYVNETLLDCDNRRTQIHPDKTDHLEKTRFVDTLSAKKSSLVQTIEDRIDHSGLAPKRYVTTCYLEPKKVPYRYLETLTWKIGSKDFNFDEEVFYHEKLRPVKFSEAMTTDVKTSPKKIMTQKEFPVEHEDEVHYISLEPQQVAIRSH